MSGQPNVEPPLVSLQAASLSFGAVQALVDVSLSLSRGERVALVGANGSGKTSLLRLLHGLTESPARSESSAKPLQIAMLFQRPFMVDLTVQRNVMLGLWLRKVPRAQRAQRSARALERVGLQGLATRAARTLSGGQQQRLALARAWALEPDVLLLDEPTASLDPSAKREVETLMQTLGDEGMTLVFSTHNLGQAKRLATRVIYLESGRLVVDLPVDRFFRDELPHDAAQFLKGELPWS